MVKGEYYLGVRCWWVFLVMGIVAIAASVAVRHILAFNPAGRVGASSLWSIGELFEQRQQRGQRLVPSQPQAAGEITRTMKPGLRHILPWLVLAAACCVPAQRAGVERPVPEPAPVRVQLLFAGDVMQHLPQVTAARRGDGFDYRGVFAYLRRRFHAADLVVVNLETTLTRTDRYTGYPCFRSPVALADAPARRRGRRGRAG